MATAYQMSEQLLPDPSSPQMSEARKRAGSEAIVTTPGRKRAASANSRLFGHFMDSKKPQATWAVGVVTLDKDPGGDVLRDTIWKRLTKMPRFRSKMVVNRFGGHWKEFSQEELLEMRDSGYLWSECLQNGEATMDDVNELIAQTNDWQYDRHKPLWRAQYVRKMADGKAVLICTINHGIGDGISLIEVLLGLKDEDPNDEKTQPRRDTKPASKTSAGKKVKGPKPGAVAKTGSFGYGVAHGLTSFTWKPDPKNSLSIPDVTKPASHKRVAQCEGIDLAELKEVKNKFPGCTLNDIFMALMTASIKGYLEEVEDPVVHNGKKVRGAFPINVRQKGQPILKNGDPGNVWSYGHFKFDFKYKSYQELVWKVKRQIDLIKVSPSPLIQYKVAKGLTGILPRRILLNNLLNMANLTTAQLSNVPGPQSTISIAGAKVEDLCFYLFAPVGLYMGIMSYNGKVSAGVNVDGSTKTDPAQLAKHWKVEFEKMKKELEEYGPGEVPVPRYWT